MQEASSCYLDDCVFCDIARGRDNKAMILWEGDDCLAFFPLEPATLGHTLIIPKCHVADLWKLDSRTGDSLMRAAISLGNAIKGALNPEGMNLITSAGAVAEQTVFHLHLHLVPRWSGDRLDKIWPDGGIDDVEQLRSAAEKIKLRVSFVK